MHKKCAASSLHCLFWQRLVACVFAKVRHCDYVGRVKCSNGKYLNAKNALNRMVNQICFYMGWHKFYVYNWNGYNNHEENDKLCANALRTMRKWIPAKRGTPERKNKQTPLMITIKWRGKRLWHLYLKVDHRPTVTKKSI